MSNIVKESGHEIELEKDKIVSIEFMGKKVTVGQNVIANGRIFKPAGTLGVVVRLHWPYKSGLTSDIIEVVFEGSSETHFMKFKDLM